MNQTTMGGQLWFVKSCAPDFTFFVCFCNALNSGYNDANILHILFCCLKNQHIASAKGSENCVLLLLDFGADPNSKGTNVLTFIACMVFLVN